MNRIDFDHAVNDLLQKADAIIPDDKMELLPPLKEMPNGRAWHQFELELWKIGEQIRQIETKEKKRLNDEQVNRILKICQNENAERGRESFVMLLARKGYASYSDRIIGLLSDADVYGHVIYTLYKMGDGRYVDFIRPFTIDQRSWIQKEAKRYVERFDK